MDKAIGVWGQQNIKTTGAAEVEDSLLLITGRQEAKGSLTRPLEALGFIIAKLAYLQY